MVLWSLAQPLFFIDLPGKTSSITWLNSNHFIEPENREFFLHVLHKLLDIGQRLHGFRRCSAQTGYQVSYPK